MVTVLLDGKQLHLEPGQAVLAHGADRNLTLHELGGDGRPETATELTRRAHK